MALTLAQQLADIDIKIDKAENAQHLEHNGKLVKRGALEALYKRREQILTKIETYGANYIEGQNTTPKSAVYGVSFG